MSTITSPEVLGVRVVKPTEVPEPLPVIVFVGGARWMASDALTRSRLIGRLAATSGAAVVLIDSDQAPMIEQSYAAAVWVEEHGADHGLDGSRMAVAGDSVGSEEAASLVRLARERAGPRFAARVRFELQARLEFDANGAEVDIALLDRPDLPLKAHEAPGGLCLDAWDSGLAFAVLQEAGVRFHGTPSCAGSDMRFVYALHPDGITIEAA